MDFLIPLIRLISVGKFNDFSAYFEGEWKIKRRPEHILAVLLYVFIHAYTAKQKRTLKPDFISFFIASIIF